MLSADRNTAQEQLLQPLDGKQLTLSLGTSSGPATKLAEACVGLRQVMDNSESLLRYSQFAMN